jgi:hypothetical protein
MLKRLMPCLPFALSLAAVSSATAQTGQPFSAQVSALFVTLSGDAYESLKNGPGFEAQLRFNPGALSIGGGFQLSSHDVDNTGFEDVLKGSVRLSGAFIEPRYVISTQSTRIAPYVSARLAYLRQSLDVDVTDPQSGQRINVEAHANGYQINGGGGLLARLTGNVNLDVGATFGYIDFGEAKDGGEAGADPDSGTNWVFRVGLAIGLGRRP